MSSGSTLDAGDAAVGNVTETGRPWWPIGLAVVALVFVLLVGAVLIGRQLQPRLGVDPAPVILPAVQATRASAVVPQATVAAGAAPTAATVGASALPPGVRVATTPLEREVEDAYYRYLTAYSDSVLNLDTSRLSDVLDGVALQWVTDEINDRKARGRPLKVIEEDRLVVLRPTADTQATVVDEYTSRSVVVDASTKQPLPRTSPPERVRQTYVFRKINGLWKVVDGTQEVLGER